MLTDVWDVVKTSFKLLFVDPNVTNKIADCENRSSGKNEFIISVPQTIFLSRVKENTGVKKKFVSSVNHRKIWLCITKRIKISNKKYQNQENDNLGASNDNNKIFTPVDCVQTTYCRAANICCVSAVGGCVRVLCYFVMGVLLPRTHGHGTLQVYTIIYIPCMYMHILYLRIIYV